MRLSTLAIFAAFSLTAVSSAQKKPDLPRPLPAQSTAPAAGDSSSRLPIKRVVLYKNGVGYFEHTARVLSLIHI